MAGVGLVALGIGAVAGQVTSTSRGANALGSVVLGVFYVLRMIGDLGDGRLTWASPVGWGQQTQPWGGEPVVAVGSSSWPLTGVLLAVAARLEARRDLGAGLMPDRPGPAGAPVRYSSPLSAWRCASSVVPSSAGASPSCCARCCSGRSSRR